jgi:hypothetical protein
MEAPDYNLGPQPLDRLMTERGLDNHVLVAASPEHLTHKQVAKARKGRRLTANLQGKIQRAWHTATICSLTESSHPMPLLHLPLPFLLTVLWWVLMFPVVWVVALPFVLVRALFRPGHYWESVRAGMGAVHRFWDEWGLVIVP